MTREIYIIANEIYADWKDAPVSVTQWLSIMGRLHTIDELYMRKPVSFIVEQFLEESEGIWEGENATKLRKELQDILNEYYEK